MPPTHDLSFTGLDKFVNKPVVENCKAKSSKEETKVVRKNDDSLIIEEWVSNNEEEDVSQPKVKKKTVRPSIDKIEFVKPKQQEKTARKTVKQRLRIEQYFQIQDYAFWDVIKNENSFKPVVQTIEGSSTPHIPGPVTADEKIQKKNDIKARSMLPMALLNENLMTFNQYKDAKSLFDAITTRFGGNDATRKTQKTLLKQITSNNDDVSIVFGVSTASPQVSTANLSDATVYTFLANQPNGSQLMHEDLEQIHEDDLEEMDLKWQLALLSMRAKRSFRRLSAKEPGEQNQESINHKKDSKCRRHVFQSNGDSEIAVLKSKLEKISKEKDDIEIKIKKFKNASQSLDKLIGSQITVKSKRSLGYVSYNVVLRPHTGRFSPLRIDLFHTGLLEFAKPSVEIYKVKPIEMARCKYHQREWIVNGTNHSRVNHSANTVLKAVLARTGLKPVNVVRVNKGKVVKASACWVWRPIKLDNALIILKKHFLKKPQGSEDFHQIVDFLNASHIRYALTENPTIYVSLINQLWRTASAKTLNNGKIELNVTVDGQDKTITEASVRRHLKLADADAMFPTMLVNEQLSLGKHPTSPVGTQHTPTVIETSPQLQNISNTYRKTRTGTRRMGIRIPQSNVPTSVADEVITKEMHDGLGKATTTASSLEAEQGSGNISKTQTKATPSGPSSLRTRSEGGPRCHVTMGVVLFRLGLKGYLTCLTNHHSEKVTHLKVRRAHKSCLLQGPYHSHQKSKEVREKALKKKGSEDENVNLVKSSKQGEAHQIAGHRMESDDTKVVDFSTASPQKDDDEITLVETLVNIKKSAAKDKGKVIMQESEPPKKIKKKEMIQISLNEEIAQKFYEEEQAQLLMDEEYAQQVQAQWVSDEARIAQENLAQAEQWDDVQAHIQADEDMA
uniref:Ribonuclease H-like domain-containing protein n=1 Tax=Tanacetum cinerariifolium TaxID=118510 RepID=A0A699GZI5_TANCI|nr:ribonuclease H-like domain-containing protein [Tanacetum cinerariifolium]